MAGRWRDPTAFRADPAAVPATRPSRRQSLALLLVLAVVAGAVAAVSYLVRPDDARTFDLFRGSVFLADSVAPVAVDLATGRPTVRLVDASAQVGAKRTQDLVVEPTADGTLLLNKQTGEFNMVDPTGFVVKSDGGVPLPQRDGATRAVGVAAQDFAYIEQTGPTGTSVYLVGSTTVQSAAAGATSVKPRAFLSMTEPTDVASGASAATGNDLWLLAGTDPQRTVRRLSLPVDSAPGATLVSTDTGTVTGAAAIATAGTSTGDGTVVADTVGIGSADQIVVRRGPDLLRTARFTAPAGVTEVLAATHGTSRLAFLLHGTAGWSVVSVASDGSDLRGPTALAGVAADAKLIAPATSEGDLYTMDTASGDLVRITADGRAEGVEGMAKYPVAEQNGRAIEDGSFDDAYALARGPRVVLNSPNHQIAVAIFADGSRPPLPIEKSSAVSVNAAGGAEALARSRIQDTPPDGSTKPGKPKSQRPVDPINNRIDCAATSQKPHIPTLGQPVPGSRSALLQWSYPVTDQNDCIPKTYVVGVKLIGSGPAPPSQVTVEGQLGVNLSGLFPSTRYEITVTAYINGKGTESSPIQITTGPEGPAAPQQVAVSTDNAGNWNLTWRSCGTVASGCVPSSTWRVIPQFCDSRGLGSPPAAVEVTADPTSVTQPGASVRGGSALLGRGLRFQVEGIGESGQVGTPSAATACTTTWAPPLTSAMRLTASRPGDLAAGTSTSTTLSLDLGSDAVRAVGGVGATVTFILDGPGGAKTKAVTVDGRRSTLTQVFTGIRAGANYTATARVSPPGHPGSAVTLDAGTITTRSQWPALTATASCPSDNVFTCTLSVRVGGVSSAASGGETFDLTDDSKLQCGSAAVALARSSFDPSTGTITKSGISQLGKLYGSCTVTVGLVESGGQPAPLYYGGVPSPRASVDVNLGAPATADLGPGDFNTTWSTNNGSSAKVQYTGSKDLGDYTQNWTETLYAPDRTTVCGRDSSEPDPSYVPAGNCVQPFGDQTSWRVVLTYEDRTNGDSHTVTVNLNGAPPSYQACAPTNFAAAWNATKLQGVSVTADGDLDGCRNWTYQLIAPDGSSCGATTGSPPATIPITCGTAPSAGDWTVSIGWTKPNGDTASADPDPPVTGDPPVA